MSACRFSWEDYELYFEKDVYSILGTKNRDEVVESTLNAIANLKNYQQRRITIEAAFVDDSNESNCQQIYVQSVAIEQGLLNNQAYRFESTERFRLEKRGNEWLATEAESTQH